MSFSLPWVVLIGIAAQSSSSPEVTRLVGELGPKPRFGPCGVGNAGIRANSVPLKAADRLVEIGPAAVEALIKVVGRRDEWANPKDANSPKRALAIETLGRIGDPRVIEPIGQVLLHHPGAEEHALAAIALAQLKAPEYVGAVVATFSDERPMPGMIRTRLTVGECVSMSLRPYGPIAHQAVLKALDAPSEVVRSHAVYAAESLAIPDLGAKLGPIARSGSGEIRYAAVTALGRCGDAGSVPVLLPFLASSDDRLAVTAAESLGKLRAHSLPALERLRTHPSPRMRRLSLYARCHWNYGKPELFRDVRGSFSDSAAEVRWQAIQILGYQSAIGLDDQRRLKGLTKDPSERVREAARSVLAGVRNNWRMETNGIW